MPEQTILFSWMLIVIAMRGMSLKYLLHFRKPELLTTPNHVAKPPLYTLLTGSYLFKMYLIILSQLCINLYSVIFCFHLHRHGKKLIVITFLWSDGDFWVTHSASFMLKKNPQVIHKKYILVITHISSWDKRMTSFFFLNPVQSSLDHIGLTF